MKKDLKIIIEKDRKGVSVSIEGKNIDMSDFLNEMIKES